MRRVVRQVHYLFLEVRSSLSQRCLQRTLSGWQTHGEVMENAVRVAHTKKSNKCANTKPSEQWVARSAHFASRQYLPRKSHALSGKPEPSVRKRPWLLQNEAIKCRVSPENENKALCTSGLSRARTHCTQNDRKKARFHCLLLPPHWTRTDSALLPRSRNLRQCKKYHNITKWS